KGIGLGWAASCEQLLAARRRPRAGAAGFALLTPGPLRHGERGATTWADEESEPGRGTGNWRGHQWLVAASGSSEQLGAVARGRRRAASSCKQQAASSKQQAAAVSVPVTRYPLPAIGVALGSHSA